jgi:uncharacterized protein
MQVDYEYMGQCLADVGVDSGASGAHGLLCGLMCAGEVSPQQRLMQEWFSGGATDDPAIVACRAAVDEMVLAVNACVDGADIGFPLLLPHEDAPLQQRAAAVSDWCEGFLYGVGLVGGTATSGLPPQAKEALQDLAEISRMDVDGIQGEEEEEVALTEVTEFIWVAAMLVYDEMAHGQDGSEK